MSTYVPDGEPPSIPLDDRRRRQVVGLLVAGIAMVPVTAILQSPAALAQDVPPVDPASGKAQSLRYLARSARLGERCDNCALYTAGRDGYGDCPLFANNAVPDTAWCSGWSQAG